MSNEKEKELQERQGRDMERQREKVIDVQNVSMCFRLTDDKILSLKEFVTRKLSGKLKTNEFWALKHVGFDVCKGEVMGIIGHNGAGKSTILKVISGILKPTEGSVTCRGNIVPMLELGSGFDMDLTGHENIFLNGAILGYSEEFLQSKYDEIVAFSELGQFTKHGKQYLLCKFICFFSAVCAVDSITVYFFDIAFIEDVPAETFYLAGYIPSPVVGNAFVDIFKQPSEYG